MMISNRNDTTSTYDEEPLEYHTIEAANNNRIAGYANSEIVLTRSTDPLTDVAISAFVRICETRSDYEMTGL